MGQRVSILQALLNPRDAEGRGLESVAGRVWSLSRQSALHLHRYIQEEQNRGLIPYALRGQQSFFSRGESCYSWARKVLRYLREGHINADLPTRWRDCFTNIPSLDLRQTLHAADQEQQRTCLIM